MPRRARCRRRGPRPPRRTSTDGGPPPGCGRWCARRVLVVPGVEHVEGGELPRRLGRGRQTGSQSSMRSAATRPCPMATVTDRSPGVTSPGGEDPRLSGHHRGVVCTTPRPRSTCSSPVRSDRSESCPRASTTESAASTSVRPGGLREAGLVELHLLDDDRTVLDVADGGQPAEPDALLLGLVDLAVVRRHPVPGPAVDDERVLGAEPLGRPGRVDGGVAAPVDRDPTTEQGSLPRLDPRGARSPRPARGRRTRPGCRPAGRPGRPTATRAASKSPPPCVAARSSTRVPAPAGRRGRGSAAPPRRAGPRQPVARDPPPHHPAGTGDSASLSTTS